MAYLTTLSNFSLNMQGNPSLCVLQLKNSVCICAYNTSVTSFCERRCSIPPDSVVALTNCTNYNYTGSTCIPRCNARLTLASLPLLTCRAKLDGNMAWQTPAAQDFDFYTSCVFEACSVCTCKQKESLVDCSGRYRAQDFWAAVVFPPWVTRVKMDNTSLVKPILFAVCCF